MLQGCESSKNVALSVAAETDSEWRSYGHDDSNDRYASLHGVAESTLPRLAPAYIFQTGVAGPLESTPLESRGILYLTSGHDAVYALNARNGELLWSYRPVLGSLQLCCGP